MPLINHPENFYVIRKLYTSKPTRQRTRYETLPPQTEQELSYQNLLEEANEEYFQREYSVALKNYLRLRGIILAQCHPELPKGPVSIAVDNSKLKLDRFIELTRKIYVDRPDDPFPPIDPEFRIDKGLFSPDPQFKPFYSIGVQGKATRTETIETLAERAKSLIRSGDLQEGLRGYEKALKLASQEGDESVAARAYNEMGSSIMLYAAGQKRPAMVQEAISHFEAAARRFAKMGDDVSQGLVFVNMTQAWRELGNQDKAAACLKKAQSLVPPDVPLRLSKGVTVVFKDLSLTAQPARATSAVMTKAKYFTYHDGLWSDTKIVYENIKKSFAAESVGLYKGTETLSIGLGESTYKQDFTTKIYDVRKSAATLEALDFCEEIFTNFVAYIPHLYFFVLPVAIGDAYAALSNYATAVSYYESALAYPYLNTAIEGKYLWIKTAKAYLKWADGLFRQEHSTEAKKKYEAIVTTNGAITATSPLYKPAYFSAAKADAQVAAAMLAGGPAAAANPVIVNIVYQAYTQLTKIKYGLNFLGLSDDYYPVTRFKHLQNTARYLAEHAIQAERSFINFRSMAEQQKIDRMQLETAFAVEQKSVQIEEKRLQDAAYEKDSARLSREYMELRKAHAREQYDTWMTKGWELTTINAALSWASNAANDQDIRYTGVQYNGSSHDFDTDVEDFYDTVGEWREVLTWELQEQRLRQQKESAEMELQLAKVREQQAAVRYDIQRLSLESARSRLQGTRDLLDYTSDRMFNEDLWFALAGAMQDITQQYLDMAVYAAFLMEKAYELEFDRNLNRIRFDYQLNGLSGLLAGDYLLKDIDSFTHDYLQNVQKKNRIRQVLSMRDEYPSAFSIFTETGILPFMTDLEFFDRRYPGTCRRKIKSIEIFVEGLIPTEGINGYLINGGVFWEWKKTGANWLKRYRVIPPERLVLSSYQLRRDYVVFQPSDDVLGIFENLDIGGSWRFVLPRSSNNLDYQAVSDVKVVLYFDAEFDASLETHVKALYGNSGQSMTILSSRFHFPDQFFKIDADRAVTFTLHRSRFRYNIDSLKAASFGVRLIGSESQAVKNVEIVLRRLSDDQTVTATTDAKGLAASVKDAADPFDPWIDISPIDEFRVEFSDAIDTSKLIDVQFILGYKYKYRPDGSL